jgi:hypothetical protein
MIVVMVVMDKHRNNRWEMLERGILIQHNDSYSWDIMIDDLRSHSNEAEGYSIHIIYNVINKVKADVEMNLRWDSDKLMNIGMRWPNHSIHDARHGSDTGGTR